MFRRKLILGLVWLVAVNAAAATPKLLKFESSVIELDTVRFDAGVCVTHFIFTNIADKPVSIVDVQSQCRCAVPKFGRTEVLPGKQSVIEVILDPSELYGEQNRHLTVVSTNGEYRRFNTITVHAYVKRDQTEGEIRYPYLLGDGLRTESRSVGVNVDTGCEIVIYNDNPYPVELKVEGGSWRLTFDSPRTIESHTRAKVDVSFNKLLYWRSQNRSDAVFYVNGRKCENALELRIRR